MKRLVPFLLSAAAATAFAAGEPVAVTEVTVAGPVAAPPTGIMPSGPLLGPLTPDEVRYDPVAVPEPVWASVLAACALSLLRRGRQ